MAFGRGNGSFKKLRSDEMSQYLGPSKDATHLQRSRIILKLVIPATLQCISNMMVEILNLIFIGSLNENFDDIDQSLLSNEELQKMKRYQAMIAGVGMGNMTQNLCALSWVLGFNSAMDTLVS